MKRQVIDYKLLSGVDATEVETKVREHVQQQQGWKPSGSLVISDGKFYQPIYRVEKVIME